MTGNVTNNTSPLIRAQLFSEFILEQINDGFLPTGLHRDVSDFGDGDTLFIPVMGEATLRDYSEDQAVQYDAVDTGQISLTITEYVSAASTISRKLQQDGYKAAALEALIPRDHLRLISERWETDLLAQAQKQTLNDPNQVNNVDHRFVAGSGATAGLITLDDFVFAKYALDKANIPAQGRVAIVDASVEAAFNNSTAAQAFINNPQFEGVVNGGMGDNLRFFRNIYGFDVLISDRLPRVASETITGGPQGSETSVTGGLVNQFFSALDDQHKPYMGAWRQMPVTDGEFNKDRQRDEFVTTARWGFGLQRPESLVSVITKEGLIK